MQYESLSISCRLGMFWKEHHFYTAANIQTSFMNKNKIVAIVLFRPKLSQKYFALLNLQNIHVAWPWLSNMVIYVFFFTTIQDCTCL